MKCTWRFVITNNKKVLLKHTNSLAFFCYLILKFKIITFDFIAFMNYLMTGIGSPTSIAIGYFKGIKKASEYLGVTEEKLSIALCSNLKGLA